MSFLYRDEKWLVVDKPASISTHKSHAGDLGMVEWLQLHHGLRVYVCSRLDKETSGVLLFALTPDASAEAQVVHEEEQSLKTYFFIAQASSRKDWVCTEPIAGKTCKTVFSQVQQGRRYSLYQAKIHRGRTHQIRRHAALASLPLLGDDQYGGDPFVRLCLHCQTVQWPGLTPWQSVVPAWFRMLLDGLSRQSRVAALVGKRYPFLSSVSDCCRLVHRGEMDVAIDKFGPYLCISGYDEELSAQKQLQQLGDLPEFLSDLCDCRGGVLKTNRRDPHRKKLFADLAEWGETAPDIFTGTEHGLQFEISLNTGQHTGLFLDQRDSRRRIAAIAQNARVANLFAFTCSFSLQALAGGARETFSVDLAGGCLNRGRRNLGLNDLTDVGISRFIKEDVRKWLGRQVRKKQAKPKEFESFDLVICDPPVFASAGKSKRFHVEKEWAGLAADVFEILSPTGIALFANNHQSGDEMYYFTVLREQFRQVTRLKPPLDFPRIKGTAEHVRIYWCEK